jgi:prepilin-type N-terminal cleavage/methylation domain-containing protein
MFNGNGKRGFTLIEVLTAMMILTISMVTIFHLFSEGLNAAKISTGYTRAVFHARAKMEEIFLADKLRQGETEGVIEEGYRWKLRIVPVEKKMEEVLLSDLLRQEKPAENIGEEYQWMLSVVPVENEADSTVPTSSQLTLFRVSVDVTWDTGEQEKTFTLSALHLAKSLVEDDNA